MTEKEILALFAENNSTAAGAFLQKYRPLLLYIISPILADEQLREECVQDIVMNVCGKFSQYDPERGSWNAWLTAIARNTALNYRRRAQSTEPLGEDIVSGEPTPEEAALQNELKDALTRAVNSLSSRDRMLFYRKYYYLQSTRQIAAELGMTERAVEGRLYRLRGRLQKILGGEGYEA